jgi:indolepyruvate decarboxylase
MDEKPIELEGIRMTAPTDRKDSTPRSADKTPPVCGVSIGDYLIRRLQDYGVRDIFGIPGDYVLAFYAQLEKSPIRLVGCTREDCAGFAADAYARLNGIGAVCVTYCVGGLSLCNSVACAYAEKSPVVVISGSPGMRERFNNPLLHHRVKDFHTQSEVFRKLCAAEAELNDPQTALREIDRVLDTVVRRRRPGYLELPRDLVGVVPDGVHNPFSKEPASDPETLAEAVAEAARRIAESKKPVIIAGVEIHRFGLQKLLLEFAEEAGIAIVCTMLGKSVIGEEHPLFAGMRIGRRGNHPVRRGERLHHPARRVHDRYQHGHLHGEPPLVELHLRHERSAADQPSPFPKRAAKGFHSRIGRCQA